MLQQLFNVADTAIVGFFDTSASLAAVGTNGEIIALIVSLSSGLILIKTPADILDTAVLYLRIYFISYPFLMLYDFGSAILRAYGCSRYPFIALTLSGIVNMLLNVIFVIVFRLGVCGVAIATVLSTMLSAFLVIHRLKRDSSALQFSLLKCRPDSGFIVPILTIGIPSAVQGAVFCFANIFVQASVNSFGSYAIAGSTIAMNFEYFAYYVITAFGQTATTFTSQNHAAGQMKRCKKIIWICMAFSVLSSLIIIEPLILFREFFAGIFSTDRIVIQQACLRIMCILFFEPLCSLYEIPAGVLRGTGHSLYPAIATIVGTCCLRILWICTIFRQYETLDILYRAFPVSWVVTILLMAAGFMIIKPLRNSTPTDHTT